MNINIALVFITMTLSKGPQRSHRGGPSSNMDNTRITCFFPQDVSQIQRIILSNVLLHTNKMSVILCAPKVQQDTDVPVFEVS